jgi:hypothetical protein
MCWPRVGEANPLFSVYIALWNNFTSKKRTLIIFSPFCSVKKSVLSRFWIHLSVFRNKLNIKIKLIDNKLYFDIKFISKYWKMNSKSWQDGLFHGTKWRENYQCSLLWCEIILLIIILSFDRNYYEKNNFTSMTRTLIIFLPFCYVKKSVLSRF